jgi:peptidoglycan/LPS O-acetylase OafA/YrhL
MTDAERVGALDGVRGIAVLLVLLFHLNLSAFAAGFLGVDIFFVLSGFLITTLLLQELASTGRISLPVFWARRVRRLLPALVLLMLAVVLAAWLTATYSERMSLRGDLLATATYVANWHFISTSSYFASTGAESPLQHVWSLAVEEQFYVLWPLAIAALVAMFHRPRVTVGALAAVGTVVSAAALAALWDPTSIERAYMGTDARIFEPLLGALAAALVASPRARAGLRRVGTPAVVIGTLGLVACLIFIRPSGASYHDGGALLVCVATLLIVVPLWHGHGGGVRKVFGWRPLVWIGVISYGVYLWHWPITLWLGARDPSATWGQLAIRRSGAALVTVAAAALSYYLIERPVRTGWRRAEAPRARAQRRRPAVVLACVPIVVLVMTAASLEATVIPPPAAGQLVILLVGDSVPKHLEPQFERQTDALGWRIVSAAYGSCPVTGETPVQPSGTAIKDAERCPSTVVDRQDDLVTAYDPDMVLWWDRYSASDFLTATGEHVVAGSDRFWDLRSQALDAAVGRLASQGAMVTFVATEPPGTGIGNRCGAYCDGWLRHQIDHYSDITQRWNTTLRSYSRSHPEEASFISITHEVCHTDVSPCNDDLDGVPARPDGTHYEGAGAEVASTALITALSPIVADVLARGTPAAAPSTSVPNGTGASGASLAPLVPAARVPGARVAATLMLTGDSVPRHLYPSLRKGAARLDWTVTSAAVGTCPVSGEAPVRPDGSQIRSNARCPSLVEATQRSEMERSDPDIIIWWDRFSVSDFKTSSGEHVHSGTDLFWRLRYRALVRTVDRLVARGRYLVFVATEPPGIGIETRCGKTCDPWIRWEIDHYADVTSRWNAMLADYAAAHPEQAAFISITSRICRRDVSPCDDSIDGVPARGDGTHYKDAGRTAATTALLDSLAPIVARVIQMGR